MTARSSAGGAMVEDDEGARRAEAPRPTRIGVSRPAGRRLRVVHCMDNLGIGGTELNAVRTMEHLDPARFDLALVSLASDGPMRSRYERLGIPIHTFSFPNLYGPAALREGLRLARLLRTLRPDVVHSHDCYDNIFAVFWARVAGVPLVIASRRWWSALPGRAYAVGNRLSYRHLAHRVLANSESVGRLVHESEGVPESSIVVIPNFLEEAAFVAPSEAERMEARHRLGVPRGAFVVGCMAKLREEKDHPTLLRAVARLAPTHRDLHLVLVGDGPREIPLRELATSLGLADRVHFAGYLPNRPNPHAWFDVSALCSLHEGFPNTVIEAMAVGTPVVATAVGGIPDAVREGETGLLVPPSDPDRLSGAISGLYRDPDLRARLGAAGRLVAESRYGAGMVMAELERLYGSRAGISGH